jgi:formylmethanofuran dehydrogenase subunit C
MNPLTFTLLARPDSWLDLSPLVPGTLDGKSLRAIGQLRLRCGRNRVRVRDLFDVCGADRRHLVFRRACELFHSVGREMADGRIEVHGHAGHYTGRGMSGGKLRVQGHVGDYAAAGMRGGRLDVSGNAGDKLGAALVDATHGMGDGLVRIGGNVGDCAGERMRRGTMLIHGNSGDYCGHQMLAGTLIVLGAVGRHAGLALQRGTLVLGRRPRQLPASFNSCGVMKMEFLRLLFKQLGGQGREFVHFRRFGPEAERFAGDLSVSGNGEILVLQNATPHRR